MKTDIKPLPRAAMNAPIPRSEMRHVVWVKFHGVIGRTTIRMPMEWIPRDGVESRTPEKFWAEDIELSDGTWQRIFWPAGEHVAVLGYGETVNLDDEVVL